jgi:hypothetical protein
MAQHYLGVPVPPGADHQCPVERFAAGSAVGAGRQKVHAVHQPREQRRIWLEMAQKNAALQLARLLAEEGSQQARTRALVEALDLAPADGDLDTFRIECFDISHTAGEATQASCVVFQNHKMQSAEYRRYNIDGITPGDDYAAMRQVLTRRYAKLAEAVARGRRGRAPARGRACPTWCWWTAARARSAWRARCLRALGLDLSLIVGVEKGEGRKVGLEELVFADGRDKVYAGAGFRRADAGGTDPRRGPPLCHHRHAGASVPGCAPAAAGWRTSRHRRQAARPPAAALWRHPRRGRGQCGRHRYRGRHFQGTGRGDLPCTALTESPAAGCGRPAGCLLSPPCCAPVASRYAAAGRSSPRPGPRTCRRGQRPAPGRADGAGRGTGTSTSCAPRNASRRPIRAETFSPGPAGVAGLHPGAAGATQPTARCATIDVCARPRFHPHTLQLAIQAIQRAAPFGPWVTCRGPGSSAKPSCTTTTSSSSCARWTP